MKIQENIKKYGFNHLVETKDGLNKVDIGRSSEMNQGELRYLSNLSKKGIKKLPIWLINFINFDELYSLRVDKKSDVLIYNRTTEKHEKKQIFRSYQSYLKTPDFNENIKKSYMFLNKSEEVPSNLLPFLYFAKSIDTRYNQMVVNWYEPDEFIESHSDCVANMINTESPILCINLNETDNLDGARILEYESKVDKTKEFIKLLNNSYYIITNNSSHRHAVGTGTEKRISITFRMMKE